MYLAPQINQVFETNKSKFIGELPYTTIQRRLNSVFEFPKDLKFKVESFEDFNVGEFNVSGLYDMTTDKRYVILNVSSLANNLCLTEYSFEDFKFLVSQAIQHETIHQDQYQFRQCDEDPVKLDFRNFSGTLDEEREYLSDLDEIDAYAHDIAMEIRFYYKNRNPYDVLKSIDKTRKISSYNYYRKTFKKCSWSKIKHKLLLKTYKWIPHV